MQCFETSISILVLQHFHFGVAVQELPSWLCSLFRFSGHCHFLVKQTLGVHFRRNPLSRNSWRKRDPQWVLERRLLDCHGVSASSQYESAFSFDFHCSSSKGTIERFSDKENTLYD